MVLRKNIHKYEIFLFILTVLNHFSLKNINLFHQSLKKVWCFNMWRYLFPHWWQCWRINLLMWCNAGLCWGIGLGLKIGQTHDSGKHTSYGSLWMWAQNCADDLMLLPFSELFFLWAMPQWHKFYPDSKKRVCGDVVGRGTGSWGLGSVTVLESGRETQLSGLQTVLMLECD